MSVSAYACAACRTPSRRQAHLAVGALSDRRRTVRCRDPSAGAEQPGPSSGRDSAASGPGRPAGLPAQAGRAPPDINVTVTYWSRDTGQVSLVRRSFDATRHLEVDVDPCLGEALVPGGVQPRTMPRGQRRSQDGAPVRVAWAAPSPAARAAIRLHPPGGVATLLGALSPFDG